MYVVTGGAGFIGSAFVAELNRRGIEDIIVVDELSTSEKWKNLVKAKFTDYQHKDQFLADLLAGRLPSGVKGIVHMGACSSTTETDLDFLVRNNYRYTLTLAEYSIRKGIRFVYASSAATYGDGSRGFDDTSDRLTTLQPLNRYGYSKHLFDLYAARNGFLDRIAGLKFFNVFGPNEYHKGEMRSVVNKSWQQIAATGQVKLFKSYRPEYRDGEQKRDFIYIKDCLDVMFWFLENPSVNGIFNLGSGKARSWNDLASSVFKAMGRPTAIQYIEMPETLKTQYQYFSEAPMQKLRQAGYSGTFMPLEDGVKDYVASYLMPGEVTL